MLKILYLASNPDGASSLLLEREQTTLAQSLFRIDRDRTVRFVSRPHLRIEDLPDLIADEMPDVLHIAAHGEEKTLLFANENNEPVAVSSENLVKMLVAIGHKFKLIVLNACDSHDVARELTRIAQFAIGTKGSIVNRAARVAAATLYGRLARASNVQSAVNAANSMLSVIQKGEAEYVLWSVPGRDPDKAVLAEPFRIVAALYDFDQKIDKGQPPPKVVQKSRDKEQFQIRYGVAGAPESTVLLVLFTDDPDVIKSMDEDDPDQCYQEHLSWIIPDTPYAGRIWIDEEEVDGTWGDMRWYATVTTAEGQYLSTATTLCDALRRYYLQEKWMGDLSKEWVDAINDAIKMLRKNIGRHRKADED